MENLKLYSSAVILQAAKTSMLYLSWLTLVIAVPMMFFKNELNFTEKVIVITGTFLAIWSLYFLSCWLFHWRSLKNKNNLSAYIALNTKERGKQLGSWLEGW